MDAPPNAPLPGGTESMDARTDEDATRLEDRHSVLGNKALGRLGRMTSCLGDCLAPAGDLVGALTNKARVSKGLV
jgi:hypothetical protein